MKSLFFILSLLGCLDLFADTKNTVSITSGAIEVITDNSANSGANGVYTINQQVPYRLKPGASVCINYLPSNNPVPSVLVGNYKLSNSGTTDVFIPTNSDTEIGLFIQNWAHLTSPNETNGTCGSVCGGQPTYPASQTPSGNLCVQGNLTSGPTLASNQQTWSWQCANGNASPSNCSATVQANPVNGVCGNSNKNIGPPDCASGTVANAVNVNRGLTSWTWTCQGSNGGTSDSSCFSYQCNNGAGCVDIHGARGGICNDSPGVNVGRILFTTSDKLTQCVCIDQGTNCR